MGRRHASYFRRRIRGGRRSNSQPQLTPAAVKEIFRRDEALRRFSAFLGQGLSREKAARRVGESVPTIWRWLKQGLVPRTFRCGRTAMLEKLAVPRSLLLMQKRIQKSKRVGNLAAWKVLAKHRACPAALARFLKSAKVLPPSMMSSTRLSAAGARAFSANNSNSR